MPEPRRFLAGVIEGFYGEPWKPAERIHLFERMAAWGLNTYLYAPKDDLKHRAIWREPYSSTESEGMGALIQSAAERGVQFIYALGPGLDIRYTDPGELDQLQRRFQQLLELGCQHFALLFDDIPDHLRAEDLRRWGSLAGAQAHVANTLCRWVQERNSHARFLFCPTPYCGRMAKRQLGGAGYLETVGRELLPEIDVFWTGPEIVSREISVEPIRELQRKLRRKPLIWDNLHANDYDGRRFFCGPSSGRPVALRDEVAGLLSNPNCEFPLNYVPLRTMAAFLATSGQWEPRAAYISAMAEWSSQFVTLGGTVALDDLILLGDAYYLPHEEGAEAEDLYQRLSDLLTTPPETWGSSHVARFLDRARRLRELCGQLAGLIDRPLFYALSRRIWELREELDLLEKYVAFRARQASSSAPFGSDFHLSGTCRGGLVARLQRLLVQAPDGSFAPASVAVESKRPENP